MDKKKSLETLPGAAVNQADKDKVDKKIVDEEIRDLNNNPRVNDDRMP